MISTSQRLAPSTRSTSSSSGSIVASAAAGSGLSNYDISYVDGALSVAVKALTITADDASKTYGDTVVFLGDSITAATSGIAAVGCTGVCTGPHVHYEVIVAGVIVNPLRYL